LLDDLAFLEKHGKRLFVQLQDVSFSDSVVLVPDYLREDSIFSGGVTRKWKVEGGDESKARPEGWSRGAGTLPCAPASSAAPAGGRAVDGRIEA